MEFKERYGNSKNGNFIVENDSVGTPHPYMITAKHLEHNPDPMYIGKEQILAMESEHGKMCGYNCGLTYEEHKSALAVLCKKNPSTKTGKTVKELRDYLQSIKDKSEENEFEGFVLVKGFKDE
jgi:hypothetical protein